MERIEIGGWVLVADAAPTRDAYRNSNRGAHGCTCVHCRNFIAVRDSAYPKAFTDFLTRLGISPDKEAEIYEIGPGDAEHTQRYGGWYHFAGHIERNPGAEVVFPATAAGTSAWHVDFRAGRDLAFESFGEHPLVQLEFRTSVPWVLPEAAH